MAVVRSLLSREHAVVASEEWAECSVVVASEVAEERWAVVGSFAALAVVEVEQAADVPPAADAARDGVGIAAAAAGLSRCVLAECAARAARSFDARLADSRCLLSLLVEEHAPPATPEAAVDGRTEAAVMLRVWESAGEEWAADAEREEAAVMAAPWLVVVAR